MQDFNLVIALNENCNTNNTDFGGHKDILFVLTVIPSKTYFCNIQFVTNFINGTNAYFEKFLVKM